jgi:hypothetical protein
VERAGRIRPQIGPIPALLACSTGDPQPLPQESARFGWARIPALIDYPLNKAARRSNVTEIKLAPGTEIAQKSRVSQNSGQKNPN